MAKQSVPDTHVHVHKGDFFPAKVVFSQEMTCARSSEGLIYD